MAITSVFTCGAECGYLPSHWTSITGPVTVSTAQKNHGANAIKIAAAGAATSARWTVPTSAHQVIRFALYLDGLPGTDAVFQTITCSAVGDCILAFDVATGKLCVAKEGDWAGRILGPVLANQTWTVIDLHVDGTTGAPTISWQVNGATQTAYTGSGATTTYVDWYLGQWFEYTGVPAYTTYTAYYDDVLISNTAADYPLGSGQVIGYRPTSDGTHTFAGTNACLGTTASPTGGTAITSAMTTAYTAVDDASIDGTGDFWNQKAISATTYAEVNFDDITDIPRAVEALVSISAASTAACTQKAVLYDGTAASDIYALGTVGVAHPTLIYQRKHYAAAPSGAWTVALFNALRARWGYASDATPDIYCDNIVLEVETSTADNRNANVTSTGGGVATEVGTKGATRAGAFTGGGILAVSAKGAHTKAVVSTGGGVTVAAIKGGRAGSATATGAGISAVGRLAGRQSAVSVTGGGVAAVTAEKAISAENHNASVSATGGGVAVVGIRTARPLVAAATGSGVATVARVAGRRSSPASVGSGVATVALRTARSNSQTATGGGVAAVSIRAGRTLAALLSGGGVLTSDATTERLGSVTATGGGVAGVVAEVSVSSVSHDANVVATGGGIAAVGIHSARSTASTATASGVASLSALAARMGAALMSGSGVLVTVQTTDRRVAPAATGAGTAIVVSEQETRAQPTASVAATGGGVASITVQTARRSAVDATGAGTVTASIASARFGAAMLSGGGVLTDAHVTKREGTSTATGAGIVTVDGLAAAALGLAARMRIAAASAGQMAIASAPGMSARSISDAPVITSARAIP